MTATAKVWTGLAEALDGDAIAPSDARYDETRRSFNGLVDRHPGLIVQPRDTPSVARAIRAARDADVPLGFRGGGHGVAGHAIVDGGLVIDLRSMRGVEVVPQGRLARAQGGALWADVDRPALAHGLAVPGGVFADTGVGGLTLGGGIGFLMGIAGLTCDNLVGAELVTAEGEIIEVDGDTDADLIWALRGGGGNFGIVTRFDLALHPVGPFYGGKIHVPLLQGEVLRRYAGVMQEAPDELVVLVETFQDPDGGGTRADLQVAWMGEAADGGNWVRQIVGDAEPTLDTLRPGTYLDIQAMNEIMEFGLRHYWKSTFVAELDEAVIGAIVDATDRARGWSCVLIEPIHGLARRRSSSHAAFPQRAAHWHVSAMGIWEDPADDVPCIEWAREAAAAFAVRSVGGTYINYIAPDEPPDRARTAYPAETLARLRRVKARFDPANVFRSNINITPEAG